MKLVVTLLVLGAALGQAEAGVASEPPMTVMGYLMDWPTAEVIEVWTMEGKVASGVLEAKGNLTAYRVALPSSGAEFLWFMVDGAHAREYVYPSQGATLTLNLTRSQDSIQNLTTEASSPMVVRGVIRHEVLSGGGAVKASREGETVASSRYDASTGNYEIRIPRWVPRVMLTADGVPAVEEVATVPGLVNLDLQPTLEESREGGGERRTPGPGALLALLGAAGAAWGRRRE